MVKRRERTEALGDAVHLNRILGADFHVTPPSLLSPRIGGHLSEMSPDTEWTG